MALPTLISQNTQRIDLPDLPVPQIDGEIFSAKKSLGREVPTELSAANQVTPQQISFAMQQQPDNSNWCWAAVAVSVSRHLNPASTWTMASLVDRAFNRTGCTAANYNCNRQWCLQNALNITGNYCRFAQPLPDAELFKISEELKKNRPLGCRMYIANQGFHFVVISAIYLKNGEPWVTVEDPQEYAEIDDSIANFRTYYKKRGTWMHTFFTKKEGGNGN